MYSPEVFRTALLSFAKILRDLEIRFHLTGGLTSIYYGEPRLTQDIDLVVDNKKLSSVKAPFIESLNHSGFIFDKEILDEALREFGWFQVLDGKEYLKLDVYARELIPGELDRSVLKYVFENEQLPLASRPDAALSKLIWISKGSHKSRRDFRTIFKSADDDDQATIREFVRNNKLDALMTEVLLESDQLP